MGEPIHPDGEYGDDCCKAPPCPFPAGQTPKYFMAHIQDVANCAEGGFFPDLRVLLTQKPLEPCKWVWPAGTDPDEVPEHVWLRFTFPNLPNSFAYHRDDVLAFRDDNFPHHQFEYENKCTCLAGCKGEGGTAIVTPVPILTMLTYDYALFPMPFPLFHSLGQAPGSHVYRFCHPNGKTNIKILFDYNLHAIAGP